MEVKKVQIQKNKKIEENITRSETLGIPFYTEDGDTREILFKSDDPEDVYLYDLIDGEKLEFLGSVSMETFLAMCRRCLELWEGESKGE